MNNLAQYKRLPTPCFVIDEEDLSKSLDRFAAALKEQFPMCIPSLSVKTNSLPYLLRVAREHGYYAEVVSADEYELALQCGFSKDHIVYNGPMKSRETFLDAMEHGALVNIETFREIGWLMSLDLSKTYSVGIRMNVNISQISPEDENHVDDNSRFGFSAESSDLIAAVKTIQDMPHIKLNRLHIHRTSRTRSLRFYERLIDYALTQAERHHLKLEQLDIGGGYYGMMPGKPAYHDYAATFKKAIERHRAANSLTVIVEPGNAIVASCFSFVTEVIDVKHHDGANYATIDGSRIDVDPLFHKTDYFKQFIYSEPAGQTAPKQVVGGCTCLEFDRLMTLENQRALQEGDRIVIDRVGAYTLCFTPLFIRYWPAVYALREDEVKLVRERWDVSKIVSINRR